MLLLPREMSLAACLLLLQVESLKETAFATDEHENLTTQPAAKPQGSRVCGKDVFPDGQV